MASSLRAADARCDERTRRHRVVKRQQRDREGFKERTVVVVVAPEGRVALADVDVVHLELHRQVVPAALAVVREGVPPAVHAHAVDEEADRARRRVALLGRGLRVGRDPGRPSLVGRALGTSGPPADALANAAGGTGEAKVATKLHNLSCRDGRHSAREVGRGLWPSVQRGDVLGGDLVRVRRDAARTDDDVRARHRHVRHVHQHGGRLREGRRRTVSGEPRRAMHARAERSVARAR